VRGVEEAGRAGGSRADDSTETDGGGRRSRRGRRLAFFGAALGAAVVIALVLRLAVFQASWIPSGSMRPTLVPGDFILVNRLAYLVREPRRGEVIVFRRDDEDYVKRVLALPGDRFSFADDFLWVNGERVDERAYLAKGAWGRTRGGVNFGDSEHLLPPERYLVLGDNRNSSDDSRGAIGYVSRDEIVGKAFMIYLSVNLPRMRSEGESGLAVLGYVRWGRMLDVIR
jgi:signal peptidase I